MRQFYLIFILMGVLFSNCIDVFAADDDVNLTDPIVWDDAEGSNGPDTITLKSQNIQRIDYTAVKDILHLIIRFKNDIPQNEQGLHIIIVKNESINPTDSLNYEISFFEISNIRSNHAIDIPVVAGEKYQIIFENLASLDVELETEGDDISNLTEIIALLIPCIMGGIVLIIAIVFIYKSRALITEEKKELNHTLQQLILLKKIDPDKVLEIVDGMYESANKEGIKLTKAFNKVTDRVSKQTKKK